MSRIIQSISLAALVVTIIPLEAFSIPTVAAQRQSSQLEQIHQNPTKFALRREVAHQAKPKNPATSTLRGGQDDQLLPPIDPEFGLKATFGKCSAVEVIGPDGKCIPAPTPDGSSKPAP